MRKRLGFAGALIFLAQQAFAQAWQAGTWDDGSFFFGRAWGPGLALECGGVSPQRISPTITGNMHPTITAPFGFLIIPDAAIIGLPKGQISGQRDDVTLTAGPTGFRLPALEWNELNGNWERGVAMTDALILAMHAEQPLTLGAAGITPLVLPVSGLRASLDTVVAFCAGNWAATGHNVPEALRGGSQTPEPVQDTLERLARADIDRACQAPSRLEPFALQRGDLDADGRPDVLLFWSGVKCLAGPLAGFPGAGACGAAMCSGDVYLSSLGGKLADGFMGLDVRLVIRPDGGSDLETVPGMGSCMAAFGRPDCTARSRWNGQRFQRLP